MQGIVDTLQSMPNPSFPDRWHYRSSNAETLSVNPFVGVEKQLSESIDIALKVLLDEAPTLASPRSFVSVGEGVGLGENQSAPLSLTGGLGKAKNDQQPVGSAKSKHLWLAASNEESE